MNQEKLISRNDKYRLEYLIKIINQYFENNKEYIKFPAEIRSIYQSMSSVSQENINLMEDLWGMLKLIEAEAMYDGLKILVSPYKTDFDSCLMKLKNHAENILNYNHFEPEDLYE